MRIAHLLPPTCRSQRFQAALQGVARVGTALPSVNLCNILRRYESLILQAAQLYNISNVYLATDDDGIIAAARATRAPARRTPCGGFAA
jgi:hypothetical protein